MEIRGFRSKALRRFWDDGTARGLPVQNTRRLEVVLAFLAQMETVDDFLALPRGRPHRLIGDRAGTYAYDVSGNWRLTFSVESDGIIDLDLEDYH